MIMCPSLSSDWNSIELPLDVNACAQLIQAKFTIARHWMELRELDRYEPCNFTETCP